MNLKELGWTTHFQLQISNEDIELNPARVVRQDASGYTLMGEFGEMTAVLVSHLSKDATSRAQLPAVGDWVLVSRHNQEADRLVIHKLLQRKTKLSRKEAGDKLDEQVIAANINTVFLVSGLDDDFNIRRMERYLVLAWDSGALPIIVLNKSDMVSEIDQKQEQLNSIAMNTPVHFVSALTGQGMDQLKAYLQEGETLALIGSSGVGKSTIINHLLGYVKFDTGEVRADDSRGRHTTSFRELVLAPGGGLIIDTPGMREIQLWGDEGLLSASFGDIEALTKQCKFADCQHHSEPGCAIKDAVEKGSLDESRLQSYQKMLAEIRHLARQTDVQSRLVLKAEQRRRARSIRKKMTKK